MQGGNKVLKGLGDRLIEEKDGRVKCGQPVIPSNPGFGPFP